MQYYFWKRSQPQPRLSDPNTTGRGHELQISMATVQMTGERKLPGLQRIETVSTKLTTRLSPKPKLNYASTATSATWPCRVLKPSTSIWHAKAMQVEQLASRSLSRTSILPIKKPSVRSAKPAKSITARSVRKASPATGTCLDTKLPLAISRKNIISHFPDIYLLSHTHCFFYNILTNILTLKGLTVAEYFRDEEGQDGTQF